MSASPNVADDRPSLRERKRAEAKAKVAEVAIALFAERGFAAVSVDEICAAAEVAPRSFFRYFPAKSDVLLEPTREIAERLDVLLAAVPSDVDDDAALADAIRQLGAYVVEHWERFAQFFAVALETSSLRLSPLGHIAARDKAITERLVARHDPPGDADWRARLLVARSMAAFRVWIEDVWTSEVADPLGHLDAILAAG